MSVCKAEVSLLRFGVFELHLTTGELRKAGIVLNLPPQPFKILALLVTRAGELVSREAIRQQIWGGETFVDFDQGLNFAINKIRISLGDDAQIPRYVETLPRRGYRFIAPVQAVETNRSVPGEQRSQEAFVTSQGNPPEPRQVTGHGRQISGPGENMPLRQWWTFGTRLAGIFMMMMAGIAVGLAWHGTLVEKREAGAEHIHSLAVLPLDNLSGDKDLGYFADGMTAELTANLARINSLRVISRTTMMQYRGARKPLPDIARELHVDAVVEGSVVRSAGTIRITVQLIDAQHDRHLWAQPYEREVTEALKVKVQDWVSLDVASRIKAELHPEEHEALGGRPVKPDAYEAYLRGWSNLSKQSLETLKESIQDFKHANDLDGSFAPAFSGLAHSYSLMAGHGALSPREAFTQARAAASKALSLDPFLAEAHVSLGLVKNYFDWDWQGAEREYKRALELSPRDAVAHVGYAEFLSMAGRHDDAILEIQRAQELDLLCVAIKGHVGQAFYYARRYDAAIEQLGSTLEIDSSRVDSRIFLAMSYEQKGMYPQSIQEFEKAKTDFNAAPVAGLARIYAKSGHAIEARRILKQLEKEESRADWFLIAGGYAALGEKDRAFDCLQKAYEKREFLLASLKVNPHMDPVRSDARFGSLLRQIGLQ